MEASFENQSSTEIPAVRNKNKTKSSLKLETSLFQIRLEDKTIAKYS